MGPFEYLEPQTLKRTLSSFNNYGNKAKVIAGGTDLVPLLKDKTLRPEYLISIGRIADLDYIRMDKNGIRIGALTTICSIDQSPQIKAHCGILCQAASQMASMAIRNVATLAGNLCNASPAADMAPALLALSATVKLVSVTGERVVPLEEYFIGPGSTVLKPNELMTEIQMPTPAPKTGGAYIKYTTGGGEELALVGVAALITMTDGTCTDVKIALGAVAPTPIRAPKTEKLLIGKKIDDNLIKKAARTASDESSPINDIRGSAEYRREMIKIIARDAIKQAAEMAKGV